MRLLYVHSSNILLPGANTIQVARMCDAFARQGAEVTLAYPRFLWDNVLHPRDVHAFYAVPESFRLRPLATVLSARLSENQLYLTASKLAAFAIETLRFMAGGSRAFPDLIYTRCFSAAFYFPLVLQALPGRGRTPVVFEAHEFPPDRFRARALGRCTGLVTITKAAAEKIIECLSVGPERVLVAPDAVPDAWLEEPLDPETARRAVGLDHRSPLAVYTGRMYPGSAQLLLATAAVVGERAHFLAVGPAWDGWSADSPALRGLRAEAERKGLRNIEFIGPVDPARIRAYQVAADVLLAPYTGELRWADYASPLKLFEYMAAGRPIVASDLPVLGEILTHGANAWLVPRDNPAAFAEAVMTLFRERNRARELAAHAREDVREYTWGARAERILGFVGRLRG